MTAARRTDRATDASPSQPDAPDERPSVAFLSYSWGTYDARTFRMARSAIRAGYRVTVYTRWQPGLRPFEQRDGYRLIRAPIDWRLAVPGLRRGARRRAAAAMAAASAGSGVVATADAVDRGTGDPDDGGEDRVEGAKGAGIESGLGRPSLARLAGRSLGLARRAVDRILRPLRRYRRLTLAFPLQPLGWAEALTAVVEPADVWHGMWAGSLPALSRMRRLHGGRTIYDSRDVYMMSREFYRLGRPLRSILAAFERRWAHEVDRVLTVNDAYAELLVEQLRLPRPAVVMNCLERWDPPTTRPDLIRAALTLSPEQAIVLYQGAFLSERGIEQSMDAILAVPDAVLVLLGFGGREPRYRAQAATAPYRGRVFVLPAVPPEALLDWTASADVMVMAIQPSTINHRFTTPQKLFEAIAVGCPVVASDLPGMAGLVSAADAGVLCDPTSPEAIAAAIRPILEASPADRARQRAAILAIAHDRFTWETQAAILLDIYRQLGPLAQPATQPLASERSRS